MQTGHVGSVRSRTLGGSVNSGLNIYDGGDTMKAIHTARAAGCAHRAARLSILTCISVASASCWFAVVSRAADELSPTCDFRAGDARLEVDGPIARLSWQSQPGSASGSAFVGRRSSPTLSFGRVFQPYEARSEFKEERPVVRLIAPAGRGEDRIRASQPGDRFSSEAHSTLRLQSITDATDDPDAIQIVLSPRPPARRHTATQVGWWQQPHQEHPAWPRTRGR